MSKLTREDKIKIYERRKKGETIPSLAKNFDVQESNIKYLIALIEKHGNVNFEEALNIEQSNENIIIPKDGMYVGIHNVVLGSGSLLDIKLEKDIILNRENARVMSDVSEKREGYLIQETFGLIDTEPNVNFKLTNEKGFEMHDVNVEKVLEKAKEYFAEEKNENEYDFD